ncbi:hypothetical protein [Nitrosopumilus sp.]|uniref:hypothetical protein n=1 Tax=Nitrosopumilus sp. TaxID=2024843 RepID=UPI00247BDD23|nr:hypothetical protein [Nitrosopumilus sp.]MCV0430520.1 hypothetical protein [Nitrosopumilus sp.]
MAQNNDNDIFEEINKKYFTELEHSVPHIQQTLFDLQNECYKSWRHAVDANTSLYKEFLADSGYEIPKAAQDILTTMGDEATKYRNICNKIAISNIETTKNAAKTWNDNADAFVDLNRKIMHYWLSAFSQKRK